jgi:hypothetical protein
VVTAFVFGVGVGLFLARIVKHIIQPAVNSAYLNCFYQRWI